MSSVETQFHVPPFPPFPSASRYVRVGSQDDALQRVRHAVEAWEAISLVIGPPGTGKSLICQVLQQYFSRDREVIVFGDTTLESPLSLQRHLLSRLDRIRGIAATSLALGDDPQLAIIERIANSSKEFAGLLLLVDEAQTLRPDVLETIRILTNVITNGRPRVSAVLLGGPQLDETLALPSLDALVQRVSTRCYVHPLTSDETIRYVRRAVENCGETANIEIDEPAIRSIHRACSGVPRLVNQLMTAAISHAHSKAQTRITTNTVEAAWAILQQLPSPLVDEPDMSRPVSNVEFGPLGDDESSELEGWEKHRDARDSCDDDFAVVEPEFTMQAEVNVRYDKATDYGAVSFDCQSDTQFDYERITSGSDVEMSRRDAPKSLETAAANESPSPSELFGDFDDEEDVSDTIQVPKLHLTVEDDDLETTLHREVQNLRAAAAPVLWVEDSDGDDLVRDDRDMLIIEDDVNAEGALVANEVAADETAEPSIAIDFHAMLAKMRASKR